METNTALVEFHWGGVQGPWLPGLGVRPEVLLRDTPGADPKSSVAEVGGKRHKPSQLVGGHDPPALRTF